MWTDDHSCEFSWTAAPAPVPSSHDLHALCYVVPHLINTVQTDPICIKTRISRLSMYSEAHAFAGGGLTPGGFVLKCASARVSEDAPRFFR